MNQTGLAQRFAWSIAALSVALTAAGVALSLVALLQSDSQQWLPVHLWFSPFSTVTFALVGALVASRQPRNPIGWICNTVAVLTGLTLFAFGYGLAGQSGRVTLPGMEIARWLDLWAWIPATLLPLTFLLLLFPDGRLPSARWRPVGWAAGLGVAAYLLSVAFHPRPPIEPNPAPNPFGIPGAGGVLDLLGVVANVLVAVGAVGSTAALVIRFRRSRGIEHEQLKWLAYAGVLALLGNIAIDGWYVARPDDPLAFDLMLIGITAALTAIALAAGIAILRHHLFDIDLIVNRTLVYGALTLLVAGVYIAFVAGLGALFQSLEDRLVAVAATVVVAIIVQPARARLQRGVNRLIYGERDDPYAVLSHLGQQIESSLPADRLLPIVVETVAQALKLPYAAISLREGEADQVAASFGSAVASPAGLAAFSLRDHTEVIGRLLVALRAPDEPFTPAEQRLLDDIARQIEVAVHNVRLTSDLQRSRERLVTTREEERRRIRRDLHDGLGPVLASQSYRLDAVLDLMNQDPTTARKLVEEVKAQTQATLAEIRRLVYELRPPALDELGLVAALQAQFADSAEGLRIRIEAAPENLPPLSAAVEVAAYRIAAEAVTNAVRHAGAHECLVRLVIVGGELQIEVRDDGQGFPSHVRPGVGLASMRERAAELGGACAVEAAPLGGTRVLACLPIQTAQA